MIEAQELTGYISSVATLTGEYNKSVEYLNPPTQTKEVTPTQETIVVLPDKDYYALTKVIVKPYPLQVKEIDISLDGVYKASDDNLDGFSQVNVNVVDRFIVSPEYVSQVAEWYNEIYYIANTSLTYVEENVSELEATEIINLIYLLGGDINE